VVAVLAPDTCRIVVADAVEAIANAADANLTAPVESCPGFDVGRLLEHTGAFCRVVEGRVARDEEWVTASGAWQDSTAEVGGDPLGWHRTWGAALCRALDTAHPSQRVSVWAGQRTRYFWFRRAAHELTVHRWDAERAAGATTPIDPFVALDGVDEFLGEFGRIAAALYGGDGDTFLFVTEEGPSFAVTAHADRLEYPSAHPVDVEVRGRAEDLLLFVWGRAAPTLLSVSGDGALVDRWRERVRV
jgi:uncharacterized protein (TIGR03083 family)